MQSRSARACCIHRYTSWRSGVSFAANAAWSRDALACITRSQPKAAAGSSISRRIGVASPMASKRCWRGRAMHEARFSDIAEQLLRGGVAPRHVRRTLFELSVHFEDLLEEL